MSKEQDQQSRAVIAAWNAQADEHNQWETLGDDEKIDWAMQAARALPASASVSCAAGGIEPVAKIHNGKLDWNIPFPEYSVDTALLTGTHDLFTAAHVQAMGRVPLGWQALPVPATKEMMVAAVKFSNGDAVYKNVAAEALEIEEAIYGETYDAMCAAAPRPPADQERKPLTDEQIEAIPVWVNFIGLWPQSRKEIVRAIEAAHGITHPTGD